jgi:hypothetical protein
MYLYLLKSPAKNNKLVSIVRATNPDQAKRLLSQLIFRKTTKFSSKKIGIAVGLLRPEVVMSDVI